jgi:hypothetical protein
VVCALLMSIHAARGQSSKSADQASGQAKNQNNNQDNNQTNYQSTVQSSRFQWGITAHLGASFQRTNFQRLPAIIYDTRNENGFRPRSNGLDPVWSLGAEGSWLLPFTFALPLRLALRADYESADMLVQAQERFIASLPVAPGSPDRRLGFVTLQRSIDAGFGTLGLSPMLEANILPRLAVGVGLRVGFNVQTALTITNEIVAVDGGAPISLVAGSEPRRVDTSFVGYANTTPVQTALLARLRYDIPVPLPSSLAQALGQTHTQGQNPRAERSLWISPELSFSYNLSSLVRGVVWQASSLRAGIALMLHEPPPEPLAEPFAEQAKTTAQDSLRAKPTNASALTTPLTPAQIASTLADTTYQRDTTLNIVSWKEEARVRLTERSVDNASVPDSANTFARTSGQTVHRVRIRETYIRSVPRPTPALAGTLDIRFAKSSSSDGRLTEAKPTEKEKKESPHSSITATLEVVTIALREFRSLADTLIFDRRDTIQAVIPPPLRLVPTVVAEAGVKSSWIDIAVANRTVATLPFDAQNNEEPYARKELGKKESKKEMSAKAASVEWDADRDATVFPERAVRLQEMQGRSGVDNSSSTSASMFSSTPQAASSALRCTLHALDNEGQRAPLDTATVVFEGMSENLLQRANTAEQRSTPARVALIATLTVPAFLEDAATQQRVDASNRQVFALLKQEWNAAKSTERKLYIVLPPSQGTERAQQIRSFVDGAVQTMGIPPSKVSYNAAYNATYNIAQGAQGTPSQTSISLVPNAAPSAAPPTVRIVLERKPAKQ